jgi:hypothetical protein
MSVRIFSRILQIVAFILVGALIARAQPSPDVATDNELFAAYCLGMAQAFLQATLHDPPAISPDAFQSTLNRRITRFHSYLVARGLTTTRSTDALIGTNLSIRRGRADWPVCGEKFKHCEACLPPDPNDYLPSAMPGMAEKHAKESQDCHEKCMKDIKEEPICRRWVRCSEDDQLPF